MQPIQQMFVAKMLGITSASVPSVFYHYVPSPVPRLSNSAGVAKRSYHMPGKAIDVRLPGFDTHSQIHKAAISLKGGGVGYYSSSNFVHLDVGRVRYW